MGNFQCAKCGKPCHRLGGHLGERCGCHTGKLDHFDDEDNELDTFETDLDSLRSEVARLTAEVEAMRAVVSTIEDFAEYDCTYGDDCPAFGARHGRCVGCKARRALDALRARKVGG